MTEQQIKEFLSRHFVGLVASRRGFKTTAPQPDNGTDLHLTRVIVQERPQGTRIMDDPNVIHLQLKCTCDASIEPDGDGFKYDLSVVAFNDLVDKWNAGHYNRSMLILMVLPDDPSTWLNVGIDELVMRRAAYWYTPAPGTPMSANASTQRIRIPYANAVSLDLFTEKFVEYYS
jgi:hypothetical protein